MSWHTPFDSEPYFQRMREVTARYLEGASLDAAAGELARIVVEWFDAISDDDRVGPERLARASQGNHTLGLSNLRPNMSELEEPRVKRLFDATADLIPHLGRGAV